MKKKGRSCIYVEVVGYECVADDYEVKIKLIIYTTSRVVDLPSFENMTEYTTKMKVPRGGY